MKLAWKPDTKARCWMIVVHIASLLKLGIPKDRLDDYEYIAEVVANAWIDSGNGRTCAVIVCISADGKLHVHVAAYGPPTTLRYVAKTLGDAHVEPQLAGKKKLKDYLLKLPPWDEKGEEILFSLGVENIQDVQGNRSDLDEIAFLLKEGATPQQIFDKCFRYRKYENMILKAFFDIKAANMPLIKEMTNYWHWGAGRTGKSHVFVDLCNKYGRENIYFMTDFQNGGLDKYMTKGAPRVLFVDDVKPEDMKYRQMLMLTDRYSDAQTHSRYSNTLNLWNEVHVTSVYPIEAYYNAVVIDWNRKVDSFDQLIGRFNTIVYHFVGVDDEYKSYSLPTEKYINAEAMKKEAWQSQYKIPLPNGLSKEEIKEYKERGLIV